jgi:hypothetical protein
MTDDATRRADTVQLGILNLQNSVDVGFARVEGQLALVIQRADQTDKLLTEHAEQIAAIDTRLDVVERSAVTREDMEKRQAASARTVGIVVSILALITSSGVAILTSLLT